LKIHEGRLIIDLDAFEAWIRSFVRAARGRRPSPSARGYDRSWYKFSREYLSAHSTCLFCGAPSTEVHHKIKLADAPLLKYHESNLMPVCKQCHGKITRGLQLRPTIEKVLEAFSA
jgi:5-methylcytosine-specific restriction endonuclease McrA